MKDTKRILFRKKAFIFLFAFIPTVALFTIISLTLLKKDHQPNSYSFSFIDNFEHAFKVNFNENVILENYLPIDKDNPFFSEMYEIVNMILPSELDYINRNGNVILNNLNEIDNGFIRLDFSNSVKRPKSYAFVFKQKGFQDYWLLKITADSNYTIDLFNNDDTGLSKVQKFSGKLLHANASSFFFFFVEDRFFAYMNRKLLFSFIDKGLARTGFYSFSSFTEQTSNEFMVKIGKLKKETIEESKLKLLVKRTDTYNFIKEGFNRKYSTNTVPTSKINSNFLRRIKCLELPKKAGDPYFTVTKPSIVFMLNSELKYDLEVPPKATLSFSLANLMEGYYDNYRANFIVSIQPDDIDTAEKHIFEFNYLNRAFKEFSINLSKYRDKKCTISFKLEDIHNLEYSFPGEILVALGSPVIYTKALREQKNAILISLDTLRQDHLSCYGYFRKTTPNIDKFAKDSMIFENAVSNSNSTLPSHMSIFTSQFPRESGFLFGITDMFMENVIPSEIKILGEYLKEIGLRTGAITGGNWVSSWVGYDRGFDSFSEWTGQDAKVTVDRAIEWLDQHKELNFFQFIHTYEIHKPYSRRYFFNRDIVSSGKKVSIKDRVIARYDSGIKYADEYIGHLLKWLKDNDLYDNTLIIITSDHGENFDINDRSDGLPGTHGKTLYDSEIKIPLIVGGATEFCKKGNYSMQVSNVDILPTILEYYGINPDRKLRGKSLLEIIEQDRERTRIAFSEFANLKQKWGTQSLRTTRKKFIERLRITGLFSYELYDLQVDKDEKNNLFNKYSKESETFMKRLKLIVSSMKTPARTLSDIQSFKKDGYEVVKNNLRALGYLGN